MVTSTEDLPPEANRVAFTRELPLEADRASSSEELPPESNKVTQVNKVATLLLEINKVTSNTIPMQGPG